MFESIVETLALSLFSLQVLLGFLEAQWLLILRLAGLQQGIACFPKFVLQVKAHHCQLCLGLCQFLDLLTVQLVLALNLKHVFKGLLEELYGIDKDSLFSLLLDDKVEHLEAKVGPGASRQM